jgi:hypothetical protein
VHRENVTLVDHEKYLRKPYPCFRPDNFKDFQQQNVIGYCGDVLLGATSSVVDFNFLVSNNNMVAARNF